MFLTHSKAAVTRALIALALVVHAGHFSLRAQQHDHYNPDHYAAIFKALDLKPGASVADVGAGDGAYSSKLAAAVGDTGRVIAVDVSPRALERLKERIAREKLTNVDVVHGDFDNPKLPVGTLDGALIVNAYHEMTEFQAMLTHIRTALKPDGRLVIVEPISDRRRTLAREAQTREHQIAPELVLQEVRAAGFNVIGLEDPFLGGHSHDNHKEWMLTLKPAPPRPPSQ